MISWIISAALGVAKMGIGLLSSRQSADLAKYQADTGMLTALGTEALKIEAVRSETYGKVVIQAMTHKVWWVAWLLFVIPVGLYDASIYFVSMFDMWLNTPGCVILDAGNMLDQGQHLCEWYIKRVPQPQGESRMAVIYFIFGAQGMAGLGAGVLAVVNRMLLHRG